MNSEKIRQVLDALGAEHIRTGDRWVSSKCVLAPWKHAGGKDNSPSFGVKVNNTGRSHFNCFSCHASGTLYDLAMQVGVLNRQNKQVYADIKRALELSIEDDGLDGEDIPDYESFKKKPPNQNIVPFPDYWLESFDPVAKHKVAMRYLDKRGIPPEVSKEFELVYDSYRSRVCFPIRTFDGHLAGLHGRDITGKHEQRYYSYAWQGHRNPQVWFGEQYVNLNKPIIVTEGNFDLLKGGQLYPNIVANMSTQFAPEKIYRIRQCGDLITWFDFGVPGDKARKHFAELLPHHNIRHIVPTEEEGDLADTPLPVISKTLESLLLTW